jgi:tetratricopeptide (TPR) repeat protein
VGTRVASEDRAPIKSGAGVTGIRYAPRMKKPDRFERVAGRIAASPGDGLQRAMAAIQNRRPDEAERIARELLSRDSRNPAALHVFGLALLAQQRPGEAIAPLEQAARGRPDPMIETHLAIALRQIGRGADALKWLEQATARQPAFAFAFHELGVLLFSQRRLPEAEAVLKRGLEVAPTMPELSVVLGGIFLDRADRANAKVAFARALANAPGHPGALYGLGTALMEDGEFAPAAERFQQALARDPNYAQARLGLGFCLLELDRADEAIACLRAVAKAAPAGFGMALRTLVTSGHGRFWLKPSAAAAFLRPSP